MAKKSKGKPTSKACQIHNLAREQFSQHAAYYAQSTVHAEGNTLGLIVDFAQGTGTEQALDIATGTGFTAFAIGPEVAHIIAIDLTPAMLGKARELARERGLQNIDFQIAAAESLPFQSASFDLVTCRIAPHHFEDVRRFLAETYRVLRPTGVFCMVDSVCPECERLIQWQNRVEKLRDASHVWGYPPSQWREMILQAGFKIEREVRARNAEIQFSGFFKTARFGVEDNLTLFSRQTPPIGGKSAEKSCDSVAFATADTCGLNPPSRWFPSQSPTAQRGSDPGVCHGQRVRYCVLSPTTTGIPDSLVF